MNSKLHEKNFTYICDSYWFKTVFLINKEGKDFLNCFFCLDLSTFSRQIKYYCLQSQKRDVIPVWALIGQEIKRLQIRILKHWEPFFGTKINTFVSNGNHLILHEYHFR